MSKPDDERERAREAILKRRAKLVAYAVAAGVAMPACGGKSSDGKPCLSFFIDGGASAGGAATAGSGPKYCLSAPGGSTSGGYGGSSVCLSVCLGMPYAGETFGGSPPISSGGASEGGASEGGASEGGAAGQGGGTIYCLSAPLGGAPPFEGGAGNGEGPNNGGAPG